MVKVALGHVGSVSAEDESALNFKEHFQLRVFNGRSADNREIDQGPFATNTATNARFFRKPFDNAGTKTFPGGYANYSHSFVYNISVPGCATPGRVFVGQRYFV